MIRLLLLSLIIVLIYLGLNAANQYDSLLVIQAYGYQLEMSLVTFAVFFIFGQLLLLAFLKIIFFILNMPNILRYKWQQRKILKANNQLLEVITQLLIGNRLKAMKLAKNVVNHQPQYDQAAVKLINLEADQTLATKWQYLTELTTNKKYSFYANSQLAENFYQQKYYTEAEKFARKAFNENDTNLAVIILLMRIYAELGKWQEFLFIISKLERINSNAQQDYQLEIASYFYMMATYYLKQGMDDKAMKYLETSLQYHPSSIKAIHLFAKLAINQQKIEHLLTIILNAFIAKPSFEIAKIYADNSPDEPMAIYQVLAQGVAPASYPVIFLALAAYLGVTEQAAELKQAHLALVENH